MELEDVFFAKFAEITPDGLFTVVGGGMNRINAESFPWSWGFLFLVARIRLGVVDAQGDHRLAIEREAPDGGREAIAEETPLVPLHSAPEPGPEGLISITLNVCLFNLRFPGPGVYKYRLKIDGREVGVAKLLLAGPPKGESSQ